MYFKEVEVILGEITFWFKPPGAAPEALKLQVGSLGVNIAAL